MIDKAQVPVSNQTQSPATRRYMRVIITLVAFCFLSLGVAVGALMRNVASVGAEDNRLEISKGAATADSLSAVFARVSEMVEPSVVNIKVSEGDDRLISPREGTGSGVLVNSSGFIITNRHVIYRAAKITVKLADRTEYPAKVIGQDVETDLAVIKIEPSKPLPTARMGDSDKLKVGDWVLAIGSPFGLEQTVTAGIISAKDRITESGSTAFQQFLQTDAAINPGNSGGPLVNLAGEIVGINTQIATTSGVYNGIGFALPSSTAVEVYNQIIANGRVRRGYLGILLDPLPPQLARLNKIPESEGVLVRELVAGESPASRAGIEGGDIILSINGDRVANVRDLIRRIAALPVGSLAEVIYIRKGERRTATVRLEERKDDAQNNINIRQLPFDPRSPQAGPEGQDRTGKPKTPQALGIRVKTLLPDLARMRGWEGVRGAIVSGVEPGSIADENDIKIDDVVTEVNQRPVASQEDFLRMTRDFKSGDDVVIKVMRKERGPLRRSLIISFTMP
ncbi:MAG TPA: trypsin-like peptidase domain-containing protein [Blastocatellia bacterium]|nr:trypsin-like peptidase domain-containing protein [Blastocatellia bacterium]